MTFIPPSARMRQIAAAAIPTPEALPFPSPTAEELFAAATPPPVEEAAPVAEPEPVVPAAVEPEEAAPAVDPDPVADPEPEPVADAAAGSDHEPVAAASLQMKRAELVAIAEGMGLTIAATDTKAEILDKITAATP